MNFPDSKGKNKDPSFKRSIKITLEKEFIRREMSLASSSQNTISHTEEINNQGCSVIVK
jgi:predicted phosphoadenosine phosphosulfate sulfurtransferase